MATEVERLVVRLEADTERLRREMLRATEGVEKSTKSINRHLAKTDKQFDQLALAVKRFAGPAALGLMARQTVVFITGQSKMAASLEDTAKKLGVTTTQLQEFRIAASQVAGITANTADMALQRFTRRVGEAANGTGELKGTLDKLGISVRDTLGAIRPIDDIMADLADSIAGTTNQSERLAIAFKAFDSEGAALVGLFQHGGDALKSFMNRASELGAVLDEKTIKSLAQANRDIDLMKTIIDVHLTTALQKIAPLLVRFAGGLAKVAGWAHDAYVWLKAIGDENIKAQIGELVDEISDLEKQIASRSRASKSGRGGGLLAGAVEDDEKALVRLKAKLVELKKELASQPNQSRNINVGGIGGGSAGRRQFLAESRAGFDDLNAVYLEGIQGRYDHEKELRKEAAEDALRDAEKVAAKQKQIAEKAAKEMERVVGRSTDRIVDFGADAFDKIFQNSKGSWRSIADDALAVMRRMFAQMAAEAIIRPIVQPIIASAVGGLMGGGGSGGGGGGGGMGGSIASSMIAKALPNPFSGIGSSIGGGLSSALFGSTLTSGGAATLGIGQAAVGATSAGLIGSGGSFLGLGSAMGPLALAGIVGAGLFLGSGMLGGSKKTPRAGARVKIDNQSGIARLGDSGATGGGNIGKNQAEARKAAEALNEIARVTGGRLSSNRDNGGAPGSGPKIDIQLTTRTENGEFTRNADDIVADALRKGVLQGVSQAKIDEILKNGIEGFEAGLNEATNSLAQMNAALDAGKGQLRSFFDGLISPLARFGLSAAFGDLSASSPGDKLTAARGQFASTLASAKAGDISAIQDLPSIGENVIGLGREVFASGPQFASLQQATTASVAGVQSGLEGQRNAAFAEFSIPLVVTVEAQTKSLLGELRRQTAALRDIEETLQRLKAA